MANSQPLVCENIRRAYRTDGDLVWALWDVDAAAHAGKITVLAGPSGSGKSTLLRVMAGIDVPDEGTVTINGRDITGMSPRQRRKFRRTNLGFVFQDPAANLLGYMSVLEHIEMAGELRCTGPDLSVLDDLEISELSNELPSHLSAGQQQRVALAAAVQGNPDVVLADEPTAELDSESAALAVETLVRLRDRNVTLVVTSHDAEVIDIADDVIRLERGVIAS